MALGRATIAELLKRVKDLERKNTADKRTQDELQGETVGRRDGSPGKVTYATVAVGCVLRWRR